MISEKERQRALDRLTQTRQLLLETLDRVTETQARWKPAADRWSILEYVEHLAVSDGELVSIVERSLKTPAMDETEEQRRQREAKIRETPMPRGVNQAPERVRPSGRFASLQEAVAAFLAARERTIEYTRTTQADLRHHFAAHSVLGPLDGYQWLAGNAHHVETHAEHIREIRRMPNFPS